MAKINTKDLTKSLLTAAIALFLVSIVGGFGIIPKDLVPIPVPGIESLGNVLLWTVGIVLSGMIVDRLM